MDRRASLDHSLAPPTSAPAVGSLPIPRPSPPAMALTLGAVPPLAEASHGGASPPLAEVHHPGSFRVDNSAGPHQTPQRRNTALPLVPPPAPMPVSRLPLMRSSVPHFTPLPPAPPALRIAPKPVDRWADLLRAANAAGSSIAGQQGCDASALPTQLQAHHQPGRSLPPLRKEAVPQASLPFVAQIRPPHISRISSGAGEHLPPRILPAPAIAPHHPEPPQSQVPLSAKDSRTERRKKRRDAAKARREDEPAAVAPVAAAANNHPPTVAQDRKDQRRLQNRASVQKCRARQKERIEDIADERDTLAIENMKLKQVKQYVEASGALDLLNMDPPVDAQPALPRMSDASPSRGSSSLLHVVNPPMLQLPPPLPACVAPTAASGNASSLPTVDQVLSPTNVQHTRSGSSSAVPRMPRAGIALLGRDGKRLTFDGHRNADPLPKKLCVPRGV